MTLESSSQYPNTAIDASEGYFVLRNIGGESWVLERRTETFSRALFQYLVLSREHSPSDIGIFQKIPIRYSDGRIPLSADTPQEVFNFEQASVIDSMLLRYLGNAAEYFQKGRASRLRGEGIAAIAYYRQVLEVCANQLIDDILIYVPESEGKREAYCCARAKARQANTAREKLELIEPHVPDGIKELHYDPVTGILNHLYDAGEPVFVDFQEGLSVENAEKVDMAIEFLVKKIIDGYQAGMGAAL